MRTKVKGGSPALATSEHIAEHPINRIEELLPWHLASAAEFSLREAA